MIDRLKYLLIKNIFIAVERDEIDEKRVWNFLLLDFIALFIILYWAMTTYPILNALYLYEFALVIIATYLGIKRIRSASSGLPTEKTILLLVALSWQLALRIFAVTFVAYNSFGYIIKEELLKLSPTIIDATYSMIFVLSAFAFFLLLGNYTAKLRRRWGNHTRHTSQQPRSR